MEATRAEQLAAEAERVLKHVRHTHYQHEPVINPETGTYDVDCSAFVGFLLEAIAPEHFALLPKTADERYPRAFELFDYLHAEAPRGWKRIASIEHAARGDVFAWRVAKVAANHDTGHVFIVARAPEFDAAANAWTVQAYDASSILHFHDSREKGGKYHSGVGRGALRFRAESGGAPTAFQFGPGAEFHKLPIVIARLEELAGTKKAAPPANAAAAPKADAREPSGRGRRAKRAAVAGEVLAEDEFAMTTYALASPTAMLLVPTTFACWGPGQKIPASLGQGNTTYTLVGGVVLCDV